MTIEKAPAKSERLCIRQLIPATPERVFSAWTDPDKLVKWWGPKDVRCLSAQVELRVGGHYRIANVLPDGSVLWITGRFEAVERPRLLIYSWAIEPETAQWERVAVRFEAHGQGCEVILTHERIPTARLRDQHRQGWLGCMAGLVEYLSP